MHSNTAAFPSQLPCVCKTQVRNIPDSLPSFLLPFTIQPQRSTKYLKLRATFKVPVYKSLLSDTPPLRHKGEEETNSHGYSSFPYPCIRNAWDG